MDPVLITRAAQEVEPTATALRAEGVPYLSAPAIRIAFHDRCDWKKPNHLATFAVLFTSASGVAAWHHLDNISSLEGITVVCMGEATQNAVYKFCGALGVKPGHVLHGNGTFDGFLDLLSEKVAPQTVLIHPSSTRVRKRLGIRLTEMRYAYEPIEVYTATAVHDLPPTVTEVLRRGHLSSQMFFSRFTLQSHADRCDALELPWRNIPALCLSQEIADYARHLEHKGVWVANTPTLQSMAQVARELAS